MTVEELGDIIADALDRIHKCIKPECKVLLAWRLPGNPDAEMVVTDDSDLDEMIRTIERSKARDQ